MTDYIATGVSLTTTSVVVLAAAEFDRAVILLPQNDDVVISFDGTNFARIQQAINIGSGISPGQATRFVLPSGKDLYAKVLGSTGGLNVIASPVTCE